jgi:AcrR family transcriptional regulator
MDDTTLPPAIRLLWGRRQRRRRGPRPALSLDGVVQAAIELADAEGLGQLSMGRVAERLGFTTMSLYRYVRSKEDLLVLMSDAANPPPPEPQPGDWRAGLREWAWGMLAGLRRRPWQLQIPITGPPIGPNGLAWMEVGLRNLAEVDLHEGEKLGVIQLLSGYVRGQAQLSYELALAARSGTGTTASYDQMLRQVVTAEEFPAIQGLIDSGVLDVPLEYDDQDDFEFGMQRVLDGVAVLIERRCADRP